MSDKQDGRSFEVPSVAGQKRSAPSLLPAFEPLLSATSPKLPRVVRRSPNASPLKTVLNQAARMNYLPSAPTSSTFLPTSSPPRTRRQGLTRTTSTVSERAPLATVPSIELSEHGEPTLMGRSSNSSHYQLSTNKLISRVHVRAAYLAATATEPRKVLIECTGWNGVKVHCQGKAWDLYKGDTFTSETQDAEIMVDVQDARVLVKWPRQEARILTPTDSDGAWDSETSPSRRPMAGDSIRSRASQASPLRRQHQQQQHRLRSPVSPSPAVQSVLPVSTGTMASNPPVSVMVQIYEDEPSDEVKKDAEGEDQPTQSTQFASQPLHGGLKDSISTEADIFSDNDEENDPIISSFGPFGANLTGRMQSLPTISSPDLRQPLRPLKEESISPQRQAQAQGHSASKRRRINPSSPEAQPHDEDPVHKMPLLISQREEDIVTFFINHLLYSQLSTTPASILLHHVHAHLRAIDGDSEANLKSIKDFELIDLEQLLRITPCVGAVKREGKDAAGKSLESEYYYIPERDPDPARRMLVKDMGIAGRRGLRECRKSHKQYYWRKPK